MLNKRQNNLLLITPSLDKQIEDIKQKIYLAMNGIVSEKMTQYGFFYKQNFGVSIPQLRNIAAQYNKNQDLAKRLWLLNIRETMIIATMIADESKLSAEDLRHWLSECSNMELIEQICMNLLARSSFSNQLAISLAQSENAHEKMAGFLLSARIYKQFSEKEIEELVSIGIENSSDTDYYLYKSISLSFSRLSRKSREVANYILKSIDSFEKSKSSSQQFILKELKEEIAFFYQQ